jgi:hypothetical protein
LVERQFQFPSKSHFFGVRRFPSVISPRLNQIAPKHCFRPWRDQSKARQARQPLALICVCFTEGFDTLDLKEAKALLDDLHT